MTITLGDIWRHPIKSHGREPLDRVTLVAGRAMPWDRTWAVAHEAARADGSAWAPSTEFSRCAKTLALMAITARLDEAAAVVTLSHPQLPDLTFAPDNPDELPRFLAWIAPITDPKRATPARILRVPDRGMTDTDYPSVSLCNIASHRDLAARLGQPELSYLRWRGNFWLDGLDAWEERAWSGRTLRLGGATLRVVEPITRCRATISNPDTGEADADTLGALRALGHQTFGIYAEVIQGGPVARGDRLEST